MRTSVILFIGLLIISCSSSSQVKQHEENKVEVIGNDLDRPKLVVGLVVDQMRYDYVYRYWDDYSDDGFKKLITDGFFFENTHFSYAPTYTGPGHASIYTGTTPEMHGIIANDWYSKDEDTSVYCVRDPLANGVGTSSSGGKMSPHRMHTSTMTDELKLATNMRAKTIGISLKDRGAILPAGHIADGAYWYSGGDEGNWVTSDRYMNELPPWVMDFNNEGNSEKYLKEGWSLLLDEAEYDESLPDNNPYEGSFSGLLRPVFPYNLKELAPKNYGYSILKGTPAGNTMSNLFAQAAIKGESLGKDDVTDFLALSFSSTDYVGHQFGPQSMEAQDIYLRLDLEIAQLIKFLDTEVGEGEYVVFLTADHGSVQVPSYLQKLQVPADYWSPGNMVIDAKAFLVKRFGVGNWILDYSNNQFFLNHKLANQKGLKMVDLENDLVDFCVEYDGVLKATTAHAMRNNEYTEGVLNVIQNGYNQERSGDVIIVSKPGWMQYSSRTGTSHGSPFAYDTHVPLIFYGWGIEKGNSFEKTYIRDIAPTVSSLLHIQMPNGCTGNTLLELMR